MDGTQIESRMAVRRGAGSYFCLGCRGVGTGVMVSCAGGFDGRYAITN
jgi:hypothetical protein